MNNKLSLCMIVKNEEKNLSECFASVKEVVDEIVVVDTGSTDNTLQIAESFNAKVFHFEWVDDFSAARNFALSKCTCNLILYLDADERLDPISISEINNIKGAEEPAGYYCTVKNIDRENSRDNSMRYVRLFPGLPEIKFSGKVHEQIIPSLKKNAIKILSSKILILHYGYNVSLSEKRLKAIRNLPLLIEEYNKSNSSYYAFQLAQTYNILEDEQNAEKYFNIAGQAANLEKKHRAQCYASLALIHHKNFRARESEENILQSLTLDNTQPFSHLLAAKIALRSSNLTIAEQKCKQAYILSGQIQKHENESAISIILDPEEILYFGLTLAIKANNSLSYQFYQNELFSIYNSETDAGEKKAALVKKLFSNSSFSSDELDALLTITNNKNVNFFIQLLSFNPNKKQVIKICENYLKKFPNEADIPKLLANLYDETGRVYEAISLLEQALLISERDAAIYFYLITFYLKIEKIDKINPLIDKLDKHFSNNPDVIGHVKLLKSKLKLLLEAY